MCDPIWQVTHRSSEMTCSRELLRTYYENRTQGAQKKTCKKKKRKKEKEKSATNH